MLGHVFIAKVYIDSNIEIEIEIEIKVTCIISNLLNGKEKQKRNTDWISLLNTYKERNI